LPATNFGGIGMTDISPEIRALVDAEVEATLNLVFESLADRLDEKKTELEKLRLQVAWPESVGPKPLREFTRVTHETYESSLRWLAELSKEIRDSVTRESS